MSDIKQTLNLNTGEAQKRLEAIAKNLRQQLNDVQQLGKEYEKTFGKLPNNLRALRETQNLLRSGGPDSQLTNAAIAGRGAQLRASDIGQYTQIFRQNAAFLKDAAKAGQDQLNLLKLQQGELGKLSRMEAQKVQVQRRAVQLTEALANSQGKVTAEVRLAATQLDRSEKLLKQITLRERERTAEVARRAKLEPQNLAQFGQDVRARREAILFGDEGASLIGVQARILAQFQLISTVYRSVGFLASQVTQFDSNLRNLQAIVGLSNSELVDLKDTLIDVSEQTKFTAIEISEAATVLGQAGFSLDQIRESIGAVSLFATAVGTDMKSAVDIFTSSISVFNLQTAESGRIADVFVNAINKSKLNLDKLTLGVQYAGNIAAQNNVEFDELVASIAAMANAGIRAGSTLGTGLRHLMIELLNPTEKLKTELYTLGISLDDVDIRSQGLIGALQNLVEGGFSASNAVRSLEVRSSAAFSAIAGQIGGINELREGINTTGSAAVANEKQMDALANQFARFQSVAVTVTEKLSGPLLGALTGLLETTSDVLSIFNEFEEELAVIGTVANTAVFAVLIGWITRMTTNLVKATATSQALSGALTATGTSAGFAARSMAALTAVMRANALVLGVTTLASLAVYLYQMRDGSSEAAQNLSDLDQQLGKITGRFNQAQETISAVSTEIDRIVDRSRRLNENQEDLNSTIETLTRRFGEFGLQIRENTTDVGDLINQILEFQSQVGNSVRVDLVSEQQIQEQRRRVLSSQFGEQQRGALGTPQRGLLDGGSGAYEFADTIRQFATNENSLGRALRFLQSDQTDRLTTNEGRQGLNQQITELISLLNQDRLFAEQRSYPPELVETIDYLNENLQSLRDNLSRQSESFRAQEQAQRNLQSIDFASLRGRAISSDISGVITNFNQSRTEINEDIDDPRVKSERAKIIGDTYINQLKKLEKELDDSPAPEAAKSAVNTQLAQAYGRIETFLTQVSEETGEQISEIRKLQTERIRRQIRQKANSVSDKTSADEIKGLQTEISELYDELLTQELNEEKQRLDKERIRSGNPLYIDALEEIERKVAAQRLETMEKLDQAIEKTFVDMDKLADDFTGFSNRLKDARNRLENSLDANDNDLQLQKDRVASAGYEQNRYRISDVQVEEMRRELERLETESLSRNVGSLAFSQGELQGILLDITDQIQERQQKLENLKEEMKNFNKSQEDSNRIERQYKDTQSELKTLESDRVTTITRLRDVTEQLTESQRELSVRTAELAEDDLGTLFNNAYNQWARSAGLMDSFSEIIGDTADGFSTMFKDIITGSASAGDAFKAFGAKIIETLLDIAAQEVVGGLLRGVLGAFSTSAGAGVSIGSGSTPAPLAFSTGGRVPGAPLARDAVNTKLQPGEFVVRKSAVDAVGVDFMRSLNSRGAAALPQPTQIFNTAPSSEGSTVNVYVVQEETLPPLGPKDVVAIISQDLAQGGPTKKLVKQVQTGSV